MDRINMATDAKSTTGYKTLLVDFIYLPFSLPFPGKNNDCGDNGKQDGNGNIYPSLERCEKAHDRISGIQQH